MSEKISDEILERINLGIYIQKCNRSCQLSLKSRNMSRNLTKNAVINNNTDPEDLFKLRPTRKILENIANKAAEEKATKLLTFDKDEFDAFSEYFDTIKCHNSGMNIVQAVEYLPFVNCCDLYEDVRPSLKRVDKIQNMKAPDIKCGNPDILYAAHTLKICTNPDKDRHLVANKQIDPDEVLINEKISVLQVNPLCNCEGDKYKQHRCHYCASVCFKFHVCNNCKIVTYCSEACLNLASEEFHNYECEGLQRHFWSMRETDYSYIAFRTMLFGALHNFDTNVRGNVSYGIMKNNYPYVYQMQSHFDKLSAGKIYEILMASTRTLIYLICRTTFFKRFPPGTTHYMYKYIGGLLVRHHCQALHNSVLLRFPNFGEGYGFNIIGCYGKAICPTVALLNHACSPNSTIILYGDRVVVKSMKCIQANEEITICYEEVNAFYDLYERNLITSQLYHFTCKCSLCTFERTWQIAPYKCISCINGKARKRQLDDLVLVFCDICNIYFELPAEKAASVCIKLYRATFAIDYLLRIAEYYAGLYQRDSLMLLDVYRILFRKYVHWGERPLEVIKFGMMTFNILETYISKLYRPLLAAKIDFYLGVIRNGNLMRLKNMSAGERQLLTFFSCQVRRTKRDLMFYLPSEFVDFYDFHLIRPLEILEQRVQFLAACGS